MQITMRVFVSSTWLDLQPERLSVEKALQRMRQTKLNGMEYFGSRDDNTRQVSLDEVNGSDVYVGIIGGRYGSGITEEEYRRAREKKIPCFLYFKDETSIQTDGRDSEAQKQELLASWKEELRRTHALGTDAFKTSDDLAARVTADLSNWLFERYGARIYLEGVQSLPFDYAGRIENFLIEYLGTSGSPVPFGGRENDLKALDSWLEESKAPYLMMAAPAGRGKSALLVRWSRQLLARENIALVFVPISIRFRTNLASVAFAALAARLARLHGEKVPDTPSVSAEAWRGLVTDYLRHPLPDGQKLVVLLDGLDEAADWEAGPDLFPLNPQGHARVVVSARYRPGDADARAWVRRLGWERHGLARAYDLNVLNREGIASVLESMGYPLAQLGGCIDIVSELFRLSQGDPLLVHLYVDDLWSRKDVAAQIIPEELKDLEPGLTGYFDRWWEDQRKLWGKDTPLKEQHVQVLLNVLACALGPLERNALLRLARDFELSSLGLDEALRPLDRFVIGDGKVQGYAFSHPRLGQYFKDSLSESEQKEWEERFLTWGRETVKGLQDGTLAPPKVSEYIVQYYGAHLERASASAETVLPLVSQGWNRAWEALEGSYAGFLNDVERVWNVCERENRQRIHQGKVPIFFDQEVRCALVRASINSLESNLSDELVVQLVREKVWTFKQGLMYARQRPTHYDCATALCRLATEIDLLESPRNEALKEALAAASLMEDESIGPLLLSLAPHLPEEVLKVVRGLKNTSPELLSAVAPHLPEHHRRGMLQEALEATHQLEISQRVEALGILATYLPSEVLMAAEDLDDLGARVVVVSAVIPHLPEQYRRGVLDEALEASLRIQTDQRARALEVLAPFLPEHVLAAARELSQSEGRIEVLIAVALHLPEQRRREVLQETLAAASKGQRTWALGMLSQYLPNEALAAARKLKDTRHRIHLLKSVAPYLPQDVLKTLEKLNTWADLDGMTGCTDVLKVLAPYLPEEVFAAAKRIWPNHARVDVLLALAPHLPQRVYEAAQELEASHQRVQVLTVVAQYQLATGREKVVREALAAAQQLEDTEECVEFLKALAPLVPEEVLSTARQLNGYARVKVLAALAPYLSDEVLAAMKELGEIWYSDVLVALAPHLPEEVLAAAKELDGNERVEVLIAVAPQLPEKVLQAASEQTAESRTPLLAAVAPHLPEGRRNMLLQEALAGASQPDQRWQIRVLELLAPHLPDEVFKTARELKVLSGFDSSLLESLAPYVPTKVLAVARKSDLHRVKLLQVLAPYVPTKVLAVARELNDYERSEVLTAVAPHLPAQVLEAASQHELQNNFALLRALVPFFPEMVLKIAHEVKDDHPQALAAVALLLPEQDRAKALQEALAIILQTTNDWERQRDLKDFLPQLMTLAPPSLYGIWSTTLREFFLTHSRKEMMITLAVMIPIIGALGGRNALERTTKALREVTAWWP